LTSNEKMKNLINARKIAKSNRNSLADWLKKASDVRQIEPFVQQAYDVLSWQCESLDKIPDNALDIKPETVESLHYSGEIILKSLPEIITSTEIDLNFEYVSTPTLSGSSMTFEYLNDIYPMISPEDQKTILPQIDLYKSLQEKHKRYENLTKKLGELKPAIKKELEIAFEELQYYKNGTSKMLSPATAIRNLVQHFKGELFAKARKTDKETPNWNIMAERLVLKQPPSPEFSLLINEKITHSSLYDKLSKILKGNMVATPDMLENLFIEVIDHIQIILSLIITK